MQRRSAVPALTDIRDAIDRITRYVAGKPTDALETDELLEAAIERCIEIISEASPRVPSELKDRHRHIPWQRIAGIGNVLRHDDDEVDPAQIWPIINEHLPALRLPVVELLRDST